MEIPAVLLPFVERLQTLYPDQYTHILDSLEKSRKVSFRINTLKASEEDVLPLLDLAKVHYIPVEGIPGTFSCSGLDRKKIANLPLWKEGKIAIQSLSSQLVSLVLDPQVNELILDACASPGSKTSHTAALMKNSGNIVANDVSWARIGKLKDVLQQLGVTNAVPVNLPAEVLWRDYEQTFDRAIVDVPCTMEGRIQFDDSETYSDWSIKKIKRLSIEQKGIIRSVSRCLKPGGLMVYSTCTLAPEENEEVIDWILEKDNSLYLEPVAIPFAPTSPAITHWHGKEYSASVQNCVRILPNEDWEGFFVAKLRKKN